MQNPEKFIKSLSKNDARKVKGAISKILQEDFSGLSLRKLKGYQDLFRIRVGKFRIIFERSKTYGIVIVRVARRNDNTYKDFF